MLGMWMGKSGLDTIAWLGVGMGCEEWTHAWRLMEYGCVCHVFCLCLTPRGCVALHSALYHGGYHCDSGEVGDG